MMSFFDFLKKKKTLDTNRPEKNYNNIITIANIISNEDPKVSEDFILLINNLDSFLNKYNEWCSQILGDISDKHTIMLLITAYWLCGYDTDYKYGSYIDWKEETTDILYDLNQVIKKLGYPIAVDDITFTDEEPTSKVLGIINNHLQKNGYTLFTLDTNSDCYHLFIATNENYQKIMQLAKEINFHFDDTYK